MFKITEEFNLDCPEYNTKIEDFKSQAKITLDGEKVELAGITAYYGRHNSPNLPKTWCFEGVENSSAVAHLAHMTLADNDAVSQMEHAEKIVTLLASGLAEDATSQEAKNEALAKALKKRLAALTPK